MPIVLLTINFLQFLLSVILRESKMESNALPNDFKAKVNVNSFYCGLDVVMFIR